MAFMTMWDVKNNQITINTSEIRELIEVEKPKADKACEWSLFLCSKKIKNTNINMNDGNSYLVNGTKEKTEKEIERIEKQWSMLFPSKETTERGIEK